jgi:hypothetical protein
VTDDPADPVQGALAGPLPLARRGPIAFFEGAGELVGLVARLVTRLTYRDRPLPMLYLIRSVAQSDLLPSLLHERMNAAAPRRVPHAYVDVEAENEDGGVSQPLIALCRQLGLDNHGFPPIEFRHFPLLIWLMEQDLGPITVNQSAELLRKLHNRLGLSWFDAIADAGSAPALGPIQTLVASLLKLVVRPVLLRVRLTGRLPGIGREFRWFMRQRYVVPRLSRSFAGFGVRLTRRHIDGEETDQVDRLIVHAFLQDLRRAYERRPWRPGDWRRTAYPVALLDNVGATNGGHALLRLINDVRNETGQSDPLLVICASEQLPVDLADLRAVDGMRDADVGLQTWEQELEVARRRLDRAGWYLPISIPKAGGARLLPSPIAAGRPPWWGRRGLSAALAVALVAGVAGWGMYQRHAHCDTLFPAGRVDVVLSGSPAECIGYSDSSSYVFQSKPAGAEAALVARLEAQIFEQNRVAEARHADPANADRPYVTLVYLAQLGVPETNPAILAGQREELEGMAIRQYQLLQPSEFGDSTTPLLRIILANGGNKMQHAPDTVSMMRRLIASDPSIVGVVGLDESRDKTSEAMGELNVLGIPMIAPTLSGDRIGESVPMYFQLVPSNRQIAELMAQYAASEGLHDALIFFREDPGDLYTSTLRSDLADPQTGVLREQGMRLTANPVDWTEEQIKQQLCLTGAYTGAVFYTGRAQDFSEFLKGVKDECGNSPPTHPIIADDSVNRYMASAMQRQDSGIAYPLLYVSKSALTTCSPPAKRDVWRGFIDQVSAGPWHACDAQSPGLGPMGERVGLAYDATDAYVRAVKGLEGDTHHSKTPLTPGTVWQRLSTLPPFDGVSGLIDFKTGLQGDPPTTVQGNHWLALMYADEVDMPSHQPTIVFHCGFVDGAAQQRASGACSSGPI